MRRTAAGGVAFGLLASGASLAAGVGVGVGGTLGIGGGMGVGGGGRTSASLRPATTAGVMATVGAASVATARPATTATAATTALAPFRSSVQTVTPATVRYTWRPGCPVGPASLRLLHLSYVGFDGQAYQGTMVVNAAVVHAVIAVFRRLYDARFPIHEMVPEDAFHGSDPASMAADNTSGFNCRLAVATGPPHWSVHAYGEAIDVNPVQNPYLEGGRSQPAAGAAYLDRSDHRPGMAYWGGLLVDAFASVGWYWGGRWSASPDYQHFSLTGG